MKEVRIPHLFLRSGIIDQKVLQNLQMVDEATTKKVVTGNYSKRGEYIPEVLRKGVIILENIINVSLKWLQFKIGKNVFIDCNWYL